jgi:hypothetical protein
MSAVYHEAIGCMACVANMVVSWVFCRASLKAPISRHAWNSVTSSARWIGNEALTGLQEKYFARLRSVYATPTFSRSAPTQDWKGVHSRVLFNCWQEVELHNDHTALLKDR